MNNSMFVSVPDEKLEDVKRLIPRLKEISGVDVEYEPRGKNFIVDAKNVSPYEAMKVVSVIKAVGYGVPSEEALKLVGEDYILEVIDLKESLGSKESLIRVKGRIIGEDGKTKRIIQEYTGVRIHVGDHFVVMLGTYEQLPIARKAIELLIKGREHSTVYKYLNKAEEELMRYRLSKVRTGREKLIK